MLIQEFKDQHIKLYSDQRKEGILNKLLVLFLLVPATIFGYYYIGGGNEDAITAKYLTQNQIIMLAIGFGFISAGILLLANSLTFVFPTKIWSAKRKYKRDIFKVIKAIRLLLDQPLKFMRVNSFQLIRFCCTRTDPAAKTKSIWLQDH